jgi:hypothetical protein
MKVSEINSRIHSECFTARIAATHNATHNKDHLHVLRRTCAAVRDLQVVECIRYPHSEKAGGGGSTPSLATITINDLANQPKISHL